ncbi:MAG: hypothetical protein N2517_08165 [Ignavibacteria bacterium]|nr:hypothetical protein [Ignavibacteria bacterium]
MTFSEIKGFLVSPETSTVKDALYYLLDQRTYDEDIVKLVAKFLTNPDKGIRDLAIDCLMTLPGEFKQTASQEIVHLIASQNIVLRNIVAEILTKYGDVCYDYLKPYLSHPNGEIRQFALDIWGNIGSQKDWVLVQNLLNDEDKNVVVSAIIALGNMRQIEVVNDLIVKFKADEEYIPFVLNALGKIGSESAKDFVLSLLNTETDQFIQFTAIDALSNFPVDSDFVDFLLEKLPNVPKQIQPYFLKVICNIGKRYCPGKRLPEHLREIARAALKEEELEIRQSALMALGKTYQPADIEFLVFELNRFEDSTTETIITNLMHSEDYNLISCFVEKIALQKDASDVFNFIFEVLFKGWEKFPRENRLNFMKSFLSLVDNFSEMVLTDYCDRFSRYDSNLFTDAFRKSYSELNFEGKSKLKEVGLRYGLL